jgi:hypothetical protein
LWNFDRGVLFTGIEVTPEVLGRGIEGSGRWFISPLEVIMMGCNWL